MLPIQQHLTTFLRVTHTVSYEQKCDIPIKSNRIRLNATPT